jgi:hypothetical protein
VSAPGSLGIIAGSVHVAVAVNAHVNEERLG